MTPTTPMEIDAVKDIELAFDKLLNTNVYKVGHTIYEADGKGLMIWYDWDNGKLQWALLDADDDIYLLKVEELDREFGYQPVLRVLMSDLEAYLREADKAQDAYDELEYVERLIQEGDL